MVAGAEHRGPARRLVHRMKYQGISAAADVLASVMACSVPEGVEALVPVPRATLRRWRYGTDPASMLAMAVARRTGLSVVAGLAPAWWWPRHAGRERRSRATPRFRAVRTPGPGWLLIDDVLTSGNTMLAAVAATDGVVRLGLTATGVGTLEETV